MKPLELFDETLDINATDNYDLTVELSEEGVSLAVLDLLRGKYVLLRHYPLVTGEKETKRSFSDIITSDDFLKKQYRKVFIVTPSPSFTLVPSAVYDPSLRNGYFRFNHSSAADTTVFSNNVTFPGAVVLFSLPAETEDVLRTYWPGATPLHHSSVLLNHISSACRNVQGHYVHLHFNRTFVTVAVTEQRNLLFCNSFACPDPADASYFLFSVLESLKVRKDEPVCISGGIEPYSEAHFSVLNFAAGVKFASPFTRHSFSYVMHDTPKHRWINLFTAASCES